MGRLEKGRKITNEVGNLGNQPHNGEETVTLQIADNTKIKMQRENVSRVRGEEEDKDKDTDKDA